MKQLGLALHNDHDISNLLFPISYRSNGGWNETTSITAMRDVTDGLSNTLKLALTGVPVSRKMWSVGVQVFSLLRSALGQLGAG